MDVIEALHKKIPNGECNSKMVRGNKVTSKISPSTIFNRQKYSMEFFQLGK